MKKHARLKTVGLGDFFFFFKDQQCYMVIFALKMEDTREAGMLWKDRVLHAVDRGPCLHTRSVLFVIPVL